VQKFRDMSPEDHRAIPMHAAAMRLEKRLRELEIKAA
jgi:hypothetical protein